MRRHMAGAAAAVLLVSACSTSSGPSRIAGSGNVVGESREVEAFTSIEVSDGVEVFLQVDPESDEHVVVVHYDDNLQDVISTAVTNGTLLIDVTESYAVDGRGRFVTVRIPELVAVTASGGASVTGEGEASALRVAASGGAKVDVHAIYTESIDVDASGGADVAVFATTSARVVAEGGADVDVFGEPPETDITEMGGATVDIRSGQPGDPSA